MFHGPTSNSLAIGHPGYGETVATLSANETVKGLVIFGFGAGNDDAGDLSAGQVTYEPRNFSNSLVLGRPGKDHLVDRCQDTELAAKVLVFARYRLDR